MNQARATVESLPTRREGGRLARRQWVALSISAAALVTAAILWFGNGDGGLNTSRTSWTANLQCASCGNQFSGTLTTTFPLQAAMCPKCGKQAGWELRRCSKCKLTFLPALAGDPPRPPPMPTCPKCGDNKFVGALIPEMLDLEATPGS